jgi:hypothetical protein
MEHSPSTHGALAWQTTPVQRPQIFHGLHRVANFVLTLPDRAQLAYWRMGILALLTGEWS